MVRIFLATANVGSVFDALETGMSAWLNEFASVVRLRDPEFVAIHFQEVGGKNYVNGSDCIEVFFRQLILKMEQLNFRNAAAFIDSRSDLEEHFTALSSIYFVRESLRLPVHIWDFQDAKFQEVIPSSASAPWKNFYVGAMLDQAHCKQKEKFPQDFYPNCKWSRKGFLRTRWRLGATVVDLVNIHLFHDSCNMLAAKAFPSQFAQHRKKTLEYTLNRIQSDDLERSPLFIFGDFNFRINAHGVMEILTKDFGEPGKDSESLLVLGTKRFHCPEQELRFKHNYEWLKQHDFECHQFSKVLHEHDLNFHPTYPFEEDENEPEKFLRTRLPAWCDRVLFTPPTRDIILKDFPIDYQLIGSKVCMGDHKPVYLSLELAAGENLPLALNETNSPQPNSTAIKAPPPPTPHHGKWGAFNNAECCWKCVACNANSTELDPSRNGGIPCSHHHHHLMLNMTQNYEESNKSSKNEQDECFIQNAKNRGKVDISGNKLGLITLNSGANPGKQVGEAKNENDPSKGNNKKLAVSWKTFSTESCAKCKNSHNHNQYSQEKTTNGLPLHFRNRSASQGSACRAKCKCHYREGMTRTSGCASCSKCSIL